MLSVIRSNKKKKKREVKHLLNRETAAFWPKREKKLRKKKYIFRNA